MRYVIKCDTTGRVGRHIFDHRITILHHYTNRDDALSFLKHKKDALRDSRFNAHTLGPDSDFYAILASKELDCINRFWVEKEQSEPERPWWLMY